MLITTSGFNADELKIGITNCTSNFGMPDLLSVQFYFLLAKSGLDTAINTLLTSLQSEVDLKLFFIG